jgi:hypothetical protein
MNRNDKLSDKLSDTIKFLDEVPENYKYSFQQMKFEENNECDLLHELEVGKGDYKDHCKTSTILRHVLIRRRNYKDTVDLSEELNTFIIKHKSDISQLRIILGNIRKRESIIERRYYVPRVRSDLTVNTPATYKEEKKL